MPDIREGLEIGGEPAVQWEEGDVNAPGGFEAALTSKVTGEAPEPSPDTPEPSGDEPEPSEPSPEGDPEDSAEVWRTRYEEAQKLIGRQGQELGELRRSQATLPDRDPETGQFVARAPQQPAGPMDIDGLVAEHGGSAMIDWAIDNAPDRIDDIARTWALSGDPEGAVFYADYRSEQGKLDTPRAVAPEPDPTVAEIATERKLVQVFKEARDSDPEFGFYEGGISAALSSEDTPDEIRLMLMSGDLDHMRAGMKFLKPYAQIESFKNGSRPTPAAAVEQPDTSAEAEEERRERIRRTAIVTGSQRLQPAGENPREGGELTSEERISRFKDQFEATESTDIASGLTINGQPVVQPRPARR